MGIFGLLAGIEKKHKAVATGGITASDIDVVCGLREAEVRAKMAEFEARTSPPIMSSGTTGGLASVATSAAAAAVVTGTRSTRFAGFNVEQLIMVADLFIRNNIPQDDLAHIIATYCKVLNKTRGENNE